MRDSIERKVALEKAAEEKEEEEGEPFFPHHVIEQTIIMLIVLASLIILTTFFPAPMEERADPFSTPEHIKPEWYFLGSYQFLKVAEKLSFIGQWAPKILGVLGQGVIVLVLLLLPFIDCASERHPLRRPVAMATCIVFLLLTIVLTLWGYYS